MAVTVNYLIYIADRKASTCIQAKLFQLLTFNLQITPQAITRLAIGQAIDLLTCSLHSELHTRHLSQTATMRHKYETNCFHCVSAEIVAKEICTGLNQYR